MCRRGRSPLSRPGLAAPGVRRRRLLAMVVEQRRRWLLALVVEQRYYPRPPVVIGTAQTVAGKEVVTPGLGRRHRARRRCLLWVGVGRLMVLGRRRKARLWLPLRGGVVRMVRGRLSLGTRS